MTTLYIKTHNITGLKYFGKTTKIGKCSNYYKGSGKHWYRHLQVHGNYITTEIYAQFDEVTQRDELVECALRFSEENNIVESKEWANMKPENGLDGALSGELHHFYGSSSESNPFWNKTHTEESRLKMSAVHKEMVAVRNILTNECMKVTREEFMTNEHLVGITSGHKMKEQTKSKISSTLKGKQLKQGVCIHCGKEMDVGNLSRYHNDNCKLIKI